MSLIRRKPRPLRRDPDTLRDTRLFIVATDDTYAPQQYFSLFQMRRVKVHVVPTQDGTSAARHVLSRLLEYEHAEDDELWMLLDTDRYATGTGLRSFTQALREARDRGVNVALSRLCFELWLLLHRVAETEAGSLANCDAVTEALRARLGQYNKSRLRESDFPSGSVREACLRAERLDATVEGGDIPAANTTRVYRLLRAIAATAPEMRDLLA